LAGLTFVRQLVDDTLVAVVDTLRTLELLYRVKAEVDVPALDVVLIELRQLLDTIELALEAKGRPLRVLLGEIARSLRLSGYAQRSALGSGLRDETRASDLLLALEGGMVPRFLLPLLQVEVPSSAETAGVELMAGGFKPIIRLVTLLAVVDMAEGPPSNGETSSAGDTRPAVKTVAVFLPKLSFHLEGFFVTGGGETTVEGGGGGTARLLLLRGAVSKAEGKANMETGSNGSRACREEDDADVLDTDLCTDEDLDALLISLAND
jgi:hypothetical protein